MSWHAMILGDLEFIELRQALEREHQREITAGGSRGYTLYGRKSGTGHHVVFVPPEAFHLFEHMPNWMERLRRHEETPDLAGFKPIPIR
jgi:hypothetical protein